MSNITINSVTFAVKTMVKAPINWWISGSGNDDSVGRIHEDRRLPAVNLKPNNYNLAQLFTFSTFIVKFQGIVRHNTNFICLHMPLSIEELDKKKCVGSADVCSHMYIPVVWSLTRCKWHHLVAIFATKTSATNWRPSMQIAVRKDISIWYLNNLGRSIVPLVMFVWYICRRKVL